MKNFLAILPNAQRVAASTHNQALSALLFLYREGLAIDWPWLNGVQWTRTPKRIPSVLTVAEVAALLFAPVRHRHALDGGDASAHQRRGF